MQQRVAVSACCVGIHSLIEDPLQDPLTIAVYRALCNVLADPLHDRGVLELLTGQLQLVSRADLGLTAVLASP